MRLSRASAAFAVAWLALPSLVVVSSTSCKGATEIIVELQTTDCSRIKSASVTAAASEQGLAKAADATKEGCEAPPRIGRAVLVPDAVADGEVFIRAVAGIGKPASECKLPSDPDCVIVDRRSKFVPNESVTVTIDLNPGPASTPQNDAGPLPEAAPPVADAGRDAADADARPPGCPDGGCVNHCDAAGCAIDCKPGEPCIIHCGGREACNGVSCGLASECTINCNVDFACVGLTKCGAEPRKCNVNCKTYEACNNIECTCPTDYDATCSVQCTASNCNSSRTARCCESPRMRCDIDPEFDRRL